MLLSEIIIKNTQFSYLEKVGIFYIDLQKLNKEENL